MELIVLFLVILLAVLIYKIERLANQQQDSDNKNNLRCEKLEKKYFKEFESLSKKVDNMAIKDEDLLKLMNVVKESTSKYIKASHTHMEAKKDFEETLEIFIEMMQDLTERHCGLRDDINKIKNNDI